MRIKLTYTQKVSIPPQFQMLFWDCPDKTTFLEKFILRILNYGNFEEIKWLYKKYPDECYKIALKYPDIRRGVKYWIKLWKNQHKN